MWKLVSAVVVILFSLVSVEVRGAVHFDITDGDCSENSTVVQQCNYMYQNEVLIAQFTWTYTPQLDCQFMVDTIACVETAMCHCNFSGDHPQLQMGYRSSMILYHFYNNLTQCSNETWRTGIESDVVEPIDDEEGVNCQKYNMTAGDLALALAVSQQPLTPETYVNKEVFLQTYLESVTELEEICAGVQQCYVQFDQDLAVALYQGNWPQFCLENERLISCLINMTCACGQSAHEKVVNIVQQERRIYKASCSAIVAFGSITEIGITCPGADLCESPDPMYNCLAEYERTVDMSNTLGEQCKALYDLANCTEELACKCGFYQQPTYYRSLAIAKHNYEKQSNCEPVSGLFPNHTGLNCGNDTEYTEAEKILTISLAEPTFVESEEESCPGIKECFDDANAKSSIAHMLKDLTSICYTEAELISCMEHAYCMCGRLNEQVVYSRLFNQRLNLVRLCSGVVPAPGLTRCRGVSTCMVDSPLMVCYDEYSYDEYMADDDFGLLCQATKNYITCTEEVGCACGLLSEAKSTEALTVYNISTLSLRNYNDYDCPRFSGTISPDELGIECADFATDEPGKATRKKLILSYADSDEVAALSAECKGVKTCFNVSDDEKGAAYLKRNFAQLCQAQQKLVGCVDEEFCKCSLNGTQKAEMYITTEMEAHENLCEKLFPITRKKCILTPPPPKKTGAADSVHVTSQGFILTLLVTLLAVMS